MSTISITEDAIKSIVSEEEKDITCQVINLKKMKTTNRMSCELSDGYFKIRAYISDPKVTESDNNAFITITSYGMLQQNEKPVGVIVHICEILQHYTEEYGKPVDFLKERNNAEALNKENKHTIDEKKFKSYAGLDRVPTHKKQQHKIDEENKSGAVLTNNELVNRNSIGNQSAHKNNENGNGPILKTPQKPQVRIASTQGQSMDNYEKIMDLYPDFQNWQIVARLTKKNYRQFISKSGKGKLTKVLNLQFMDSTGAKITGAMFGQSANDFYQALKQDAIYIVSKGQIREDQFNQNKGKNYSRYTLMFTRQSQFKICKNTDLVPQSETNLRDLGFILQNRNIGQEYDAVAILLSIQEQVEIPKDNKTLYKQVMEICDPVNQLVMEAIIWNKNMVVDQRIVGKTVGLFGFRLNQFNQKLSLNSSYQSEIRVLEGHPYKKYQGRIDKDKMEMLSQKKEKNQIEEDCKNLKQLENQVAYLTEGKQIRSTLTLILTFISNKKWSYESCPHCRRSGQANNRCQFCDKYIQETIPRFKLNVQLSDCCGSIWVTGFQQLGTKLFSDYTDGIKGLSKLEQVQRHRQFEKRLYQEFTVKITSKFDRDGQVKHTLNRVFDCNILSISKKNIQRIKKHL